jgi:hypothetical protein
MRIVLPLSGIAEWDHSHGNGAWHSLANAHLTRDFTRPCKRRRRPVDVLDALSQAGGVTYRFGDHTACFLYPTRNAGTSRASQAFRQAEDVGHVEREVAEPQSRGVQSSAEMLGNQSCYGLVIEAGGAKNAWVKDTEDNILAIIQAV